MKCPECRREKRKQVNYDHGHKLAMKATPIQLVNLLRHVESARDFGDYTDFDRGIEAAAKVRIDLTNLV